MAGRIRTIKPELLEDERTATLSHEAFRLFVGLLLLADDYGNFRANPKMLDGAVYHSQETREGLASLLDELARVSLVTLYRVRDQAYGHLRGWDKHQKVDKPSKPRMPSPSDVEAVRIASISATSRDPRGSVVESSRGSRETLAPDLRSPISDLDLDHSEIPPVCVDPSPVSNAREEPGQHTHTPEFGKERRDQESDGLPPAPDGPWLAEQFQQHEALQRFAEDAGLMTDLATGFQHRACSRAMAEHTITQFVAKEGGDARGMDRSAFQRRFGGFVTNAKPFSAARPTAADPQNSEVREALRVFDELWSKANGGRKRGSDDGDPEAAAVLVGLAKEGAAKVGGGIHGRQVFRHVAAAYLADSDRFLADKLWPLRMLPKKFSHYALPESPAAKAVRAEPEPPPLTPEQLAATAQVARAMTATLGTGPSVAGTIVPRLRAVRGGA